MTEECKNFAEYVKHIEEEQKNRIESLVKFIKEKKSISLDNYCSYYTSCTIHSMNIKISKDGLIDFDNDKKIINSQKAKKGWITRRKNQIDKVLNKALPAKKVNKL